MGLKADIKGLAWDIKALPIHGPDDPCSYCGGDRPLAVGFYFEDPEFAYLNREPEVCPVCGRLADSFWRIDYRPEVVSAVILYLEQARNNGAAPENIDALKELFQGHVYGAQGRERHKVIVRDQCYPWLRDYVQQVVKAGAVEAGLPATTSNGRMETRL
jgi:hypothetical protein